MLLGLIMLILAPSQTHAQTISPALVQGFMIQATGDWASTETPTAMVQYLINSHANYVFVAANQANPNPPYDQTLRQLINAGLKLQVRINPFMTSQGGGLGSQKSLTELLSESQALLNSGLYYSIVIDNAVDCSNPTLQQIVNGLKAQGWKDISENDTGWQKALSPLGVGVTWHQKAFGVLAGSTGSYTPGSLVGKPALTSNDLDFINHIHSYDPGSTVVLRLELDNEAQTFGALALQDQEYLLSAWASNQTRYGYLFNYPLFTAYTIPNGGKPYYDSVEAGTYNFQVQLIAQYNIAQPASEATSTSATSSISSAVEASSVTASPTSMASSIPSSATTVSSVVTSPAIPGFPWEAILAGIILGMTALAVARRRRK